MIPHEYDIHWFSEGIRLIVGGLESVISTLVHPLNLSHGLPAKFKLLESIPRFATLSGFENGEQVLVVAPVQVGIPIGIPRRGDLDVRSNQSKSVPPSTPHDPKPSTDSSAFSSVVPRAMFLFLVLDIISVVLIHKSLTIPCASKLFIAQWMIGGILLGFPVTWLVDSVRQEYSFRASFLTELAFIATSFLWLCYGGARIFNSVSACVDTIAPLWWLSYVTSVLSLSITGTVIFCMIVTTVLSLVYGSTGGNPK